MSSSFIDVVIYFYIFICLALLVYNILYILFSKRRSKAQIRRGDKWFRELEAELKNLEQGGSVSPRHQRRMARKLKKIQQLMGYHNGLERGRQKYPQPIIQQYLNENDTILQSLAHAYGRRPAMERAYYAYLMSEFCPSNPEQLPRILLGYLEDSTIFCRENVLHALFSIGQAEPVEAALSLFHERSWYHNPRLISDGLAGFTGDKDMLARKLWRRCQYWNENLQVAVVQFATAVSDAFAEEFLTALQEDTLHLEGQFALIRYFQRHSYPPAKATLLTLLKEDQGNSRGIAAASALSRYPGEDTWQALMEAVRSRNYYVRKNAAQSLVSMGATGDHAKFLQESGDRYAAEMLEYALRGRAAKRPDTAQGHQKKEVSL